MHAHLILFLIFYTWSMREKVLIFYNLEPDTVESIVVDWFRHLKKETLTKQNSAEKILSNYYRIGIFHEL